MLTQVKKDLYGAPKMKQIYHILSKIHKNYFSSLYVRKNSHAKSAQIQSLTALGRVSKSTHHIYEFRSDYASTKFWAFEKNRL